MLCRVQLIGLMRGYLKIANRGIVSERIRKVVIGYVPGTLRATLKVRAASLTLSKVCKNKSRIFRSVSFRKGSLSFQIQHLLKSRVAVTLCNLASYIAIRKILEETSTLPARREHFVLLVLVILDSIQVPGGEFIKCQCQDLIKRQHSRLRYVRYFVIDSSANKYRQQKEPCKIAPYTARQLTKQFRLE